LTRVLSDPTQRDFFRPDWKKLKNLTVLGEIFQTQTMDAADPTQPKQQKLTRPDPDQIFLTWTHH